VKNLNFWVIVALLGYIGYSQLAEVNTPPLTAQEVVFSESFETDLIQEIGFLNQEPGIFYGHGQHFRKNGAVTYFVDKEGRRLFGEDEHYHEIISFKEDMWLGKLGAMIYLLDKDGKKLSNGYHEIVPLSDGTYRAKKGAMEYHLDENGQVTQ